MYIQCEYLHSLEANKKKSRVIPTYLVRVKCVDGTTAGLGCR